MNHWFAIAASTIFISVFALIISEKTHLMIAGLLGALLLVLLNILSLEEAIGASPAILKPNFEGQLPSEILPLFYAMMYGVTLGGNGTLVGASSSIVAAGIAEQHGRRISFKTFLKYGIPVMLCQLVTIGLYLIVRFLILP
jgi:Na+/H+ antiporter NhaD/arsenite permease-like protein